jgi:hypothetical protein
MEIYRILPKKNLKTFSHEKFFQTYKYHSAIKFNHCSVFWKKNNTYKCLKKQISFKGYLHEGGCSIFSVFSKYFLHINDNLVLTNRILLVNDRGFDEELSLVYGNSKKIFFQLEKINKGAWYDWVLL